MHISVVPTVPLQKDKPSAEEAESYKAMILWAGHSTAHAWREWADPPSYPQAALGAPRATLRLHWPRMRPSSRSAARHRDLVED